MANVFERCLPELAIFGLCSNEVIIKSSQDFIASMPIKGSLFDGLDIAEVIELPQSVGVDAILLQQMECQMSM